METYISTPSELSFIISILSAFGIGAIISAIINWLANKNIQKYNLKIMMYERKLPIYQKAHYYLRKMWRNLGYDAVIKDTKFLEIWLDRNYMYLDNESRKTFHIAILNYSSHNSNTNNSERIEIFNSIKKAHIALFKGIQQNIICDKKELKSEIEAWKK